MSNTRTGQARMDVFRETCKSRGYRLTPQRMEVFREIDESDDHPSADIIFERVRNRVPSISLDTVYRILYWLEEVGLVGRVQIAGDRLRFDGNSADHHHFVCSKCGAIRDFASAEVDEVQLPDEVQSWGRIDVRHLQIRGVCLDCLGDTDD